MDSFRDISKVKNPAAARQRSNNYLEPNENVLGEYDTVTLTMFYLKVLNDLVSQNS